jgi:acetylornithine/N-succinyldiaminopimelate aminotransferase
MNIINNPNSGRSYSPARARLLTLIAEILSPNLTRAFVANSRAEANDAAIKLARKHGQDRYYIDRSELPWVTP